LFGTLARLSARGKVHEVADLAEYQATVNPGGGGLDSNPYGLLTAHRSRVVADAGGNSLLRIKADGTVSTLAIFPSRPQGRSTDAVPTSVVVGPDDAYYVGELSGVPFATGAANIYRVEPGQAPEVFLTGFTTIIDLDFGPDDSLYVLEHSTGPAFFARPGQITRVAPDGTRSVVYSGLIRPTSLVVDEDGTIYVTNNAIVAGLGQVLKIEQQQDDDRDSGREDRR
jgi:sugar lactone lactonase YvrE